MELYASTSYRMSRLLTEAYSTSFSMSMRLFSSEIRPHIYAIYGMVRIADEIVDTYTGDDQRQLLDDLEKEVKAAVKRGYSPNPAVHTYALTARQFGIPASLVAAFFKSMRMDLSAQKYTQSLYDTYIYGSAEVVGLMSLKVFTNGDDARYQKLERGARHLGAAYQKVNFLRDIKADAAELGRWYFPISSFKAFDDTARDRIIKDIEKDFRSARKAVAQLPDSSRRAVSLSMAYYELLLDKIRRTPAHVLKTRRVRIHNFKKIQLLLLARLKNHEI